MVAESCESFTDFTPESHSLEMTGNFNFQILLNKHHSYLFQVEDCHWVDTMKQYLVIGYRMDSLPFDEVKVSADIKGP